MADEPTPKQRAAAQNLTEALTRYLDTRSVAIVGVKNGRPNEIGSGVCIEIRGRYFIGTAAHVVEPYPSEDLFLVTQNARQTGTVPIIARGHRDDPADVAWLEIDQAAARRVPRDFVTLEQFQLHCADIGDDLALLYGSPVDRIEQVNDHELDIGPVGFLTGAPDGSSLPPAADRSMHMFLDYPRDGRTDVLGNPVQAPKAFGFSGGGVWLSRINENGLWSPESARLVAIETSWKTWSWVKCTQVQHWLQMLAEDHEAIRDVVNALLASKRTD